VINDQAFGNVYKQCARFVPEVRGQAPRGQDTDEGILRQVSRVTGVAQLSAQPSVKPTVMISVQNVNLLRCEIRRRHVALLSTVEHRC
jgi:hypothetical protein